MNLLLELLDAMRCVLIALRWHCCPASKQPRLLRCSVYMAPPLIPSRYPHVPPSV